MAELSEFRQIIKDYASETLFNVSENVNAASKVGADYMRTFISGGSATGTDWHVFKNTANGFDYGARIGNKIAGLDRFGVSGHSGQMLGSVTNKMLKSNTKTISGTFGWLKTQKQYFIQQDAGTYSKKGVGMGLLNEGSNVLQNYGAAINAQEHLITTMRKDGYK
jgi:hypothetical protein